MRKNNGIDPTGQNIGSWDAWAIHIVRSLDHLQEETDKLHDDVLRLKIRSGIVGGIFGALGGAIVTFIMFYALNQLS